MPFAPKKGMCSALVDVCSAIVDVRYGSLADMCVAKTYVRFAPESDRESRHPQRVMSALPPKADMCGALAQVRYGPEADIARLFDHLTCGGE